MASEVIRISAVASAARRRTRAAKVPENLSHNLNGQRLGRKGRDTRERIIAAAQEILTEPIEDGLITLSEVARRASIAAAAPRSRWRSILAIATTRSSLP